MHIHKHKHTHKLKKSSKIVKKYRANLPEQLQNYCLERHIDFTLKNLI